MGVHERVSEGRGRVEERGSERGRRVSVHDGQGEKVYLRGLRMRGKGRGRGCVHKRYSEVRPRGSGLPEEGKMLGNEGYWP